MDVGFVAQAWATARIALGWPIERATSEYVRVAPSGDGASSHVGNPRGHDLRGRLGDEHRLGVLGGELSAAIDHDSILLADRP